MSNVAATTVENGIGVVTIDLPPVNAIGIAIRQVISQQNARVRCDAGPGGTHDGSR